ncbi:hypothetical protein E4T89_07820 [Jeotgalicoccus nanhaiensis]|uniref:Uncharacterized protein n=1 Tax=Jeotgalicoccus nanhaiensis TaxID=568603 RepID=A0ABR9XYX5_9STAP|nr:hypothetical protein [Jeotgalicoccus nanhaiensis]MBF0754183.1 hypothetical protein [Jeotgalicoccus nanhaiensis]TFU61367.1 hypothetical protein E4T89_07820 [Jeotgalicoccus nanhaiensis]
MKKLWFMPFLILLLIMTACSNDTENNETASEESSEENSEEKNIENREEDEADTANTENQEESEAGQSEEESEPADDTEEDKTGKQTAADQADQSDSSSDLMFDLNSPEVQAQLLGTSAGNDEGTFEQDFITEGMTQTEVEELYDPYEFTFYSGGASPAFHGNLGVVYSERAPYGPGDDGSDSSINPDENYVEYVWYYAHIESDELINALGEPDDYNDGSQSMNGLPHYVYEGEGDDGRYYITGASTYNSPEGERIGLIKREIFDEDPKEQASSDNGERYFEDYYTEGFPVELTEEDDYFTYDTLRNFIFKTYLDNLADYYNDENDDVLSILEGNALDKIQANKASGNFADHQNYPGTTASVQQISEREYQITVNRTYSHATSNGQETRQVTYTVLDTNGMLKITDYE